MRSLKKIIVALVLFLTMAGSSTLFVASIRHSRIAVQTTFQDDLAGLVEVISSEIQTDIQRKYDVMTQIGNLRMFKDEAISMDEKQDQLDTITLADKEIIGINIMDLQGNLRVAGAGYLNFKEDPYFTEPVKGNNAILGPLVNTVTNEMTMFYGSPIRNSNGRVINTMLIAADGGVLCDICEHVVFGETGHAIIIDRESGVTVGHKNRENVINAVNFPKIASEDPSLEVFNNLLQDMCQGNVGGGYYNYEGTKRYISYTPISGTTWSAAIIIDYDEYDAKLRNLRHTIFTVAFLIVLLGLLISIYVGHSIQPLKDVGDAIKEIASGNADLTRRLYIKRPKLEIKYVIDGFNSFVEKLQHIVSNIQESESTLSNINKDLQNSSESTTISIAQIISNIEHVRDEIDGQTHSINETASTMNEMSSNMQSFERIISVQTESVEVASTAVEEMVGNISSVNSSVEKMVSAFKDLENNAEIGIKTQNEVNERLQQIDEQSNMLQDANTAIADIANQTNLLAMNAAIEAAHAGEAGKGFSVVADEIRKLSETSSTQSKSIGEELKKVKDSINEVVTASMNAATAFTTVSSSIQNTDQILHQIQGAMEEQQIGSKQIMDALHTMNDTSTEVKAASLEMQKGNEHISNEVSTLQNSSDTINNAIKKMSSGAEGINESGKTLTNIIQEVSESINHIGNEINQFKV